MASLVNIALILLRKWIWYIKIFICQGRCYNFKPLICATSPGPNCLVCPIPYSSTNTFQSLCNLYEGLWSNLCKILDTFGNETFLITNIIFYYYQKTENQKQFCYPANIWNEQDFKKSMTVSRTLAVLKRKLTVVNNDS